MGYVIPDGFSKLEFKQEYAKWEQKLQNSGFIDIEYRSPSHTGHFTPFFRQNGSTATFQTLYDPFKEEYFALAREFDSYMAERVWFKEALTNKRVKRTRWSWAFEGDADMMKYLWYLHIEGIPYRAVAKAVSGKPSKWLRNVQSVPPRLKRDVSVFWAHDWTDKILNLFWKFAFDRGYTKDPRTEYVSRKQKKLITPPNS